MPSSLGFVFLLTLLGTCSWPTSGGHGGQEQPLVAITPRQSDAASRSPSANLRLDLKLILVPVSVTDALDRPVTTLSRDSFRLKEDGVEQTISSFSQEEGP